MKVYGLYGKSGTGKSFHAMSLAGRLGADALIDDGLFIAENVVLAGTSAKREATKIGAIKTALFTDDAHAEEVKAKIRETAPKGILILGTSKEMIVKIAERLELPQPSKMVAIEEITTKKERDIAVHMREDKGTHVIPVPTLEIKRQFSGYFMDPFSIFRDLAPGKLKPVGERTLVRPTYSYLGDYKIADSCIVEIVTYAGEQTDGVAKVSRVQIDPEADSVRLLLTASFYEGVSVPGTARTLQKNIREQMETMTALNISAVDVEVKNLR